MTQKLSKHKLKRNILNLRDAYMKFTENTTVTWQNMRSTDYRHKKKASSTATRCDEHMKRKKSRGEYEKPSDKARSLFMSAVQ